MTDILLTNDDGIDAAGLAALRRALDPLGTVVTLAPRQQPQRHRAQHHDRPGPARARGPSSATGSAGSRSTARRPTACGPAALGFFGGRPEIVVAGANMGANLGDDVAYSGTVAAALEAALLGLPAIAVSVQGRVPRHIDDVVRLVVPVVERIMAGGLPPGVVLNVNLPDLPAAAVRGAQVTILGCASVHDRLVLEAADGGTRSADASTVTSVTVSTRPAPTSRRWRPGSCRSRRCTSTSSTCARSSWSRVGT